jgi:hypothetical protein
LDPDRLTLVQAFVEQPGKMRSTRRADDDYLAAVGDDLTESGP